MDRISCLKTFFVGGVLSRHVKGSSIPYILEIFLKWTAHVLLFDDDVLSKYFTTSNTLQSGFVHKL